MERFGLHERKLCDGFFFSIENFERLRKYPLPKWTGLLYKIDVSLASALAACLLCPYHDIASNLQQPMVGTDHYIVFIAILPFHLSKFKSCTWQDSNSVYLCLLSAAWIVLVWWLYMDWIHPNVCSYMICTLNLQIRSNLM